LIYLKAVLLFNRAAFFVPKNDFICSENTDMLLFNGPAVEFDTFYEKAKFIFVWRIVYIFSLVIPFLIFQVYIVNFQFVYFYTPIGIALYVSLYLLWKKKNYVQISKVLFSFFTLVIACSLFIVKNDFHYHEAVWMIVVVLSSFYAINRKWGYIFLAFNSIFYAVFFIFCFQGLSFFELIENKTLHLQMSIEFAFAMFLIAYIMVQYEVLNKEALDNATNALTELKEEQRNSIYKNKENTVLLQEIHHRVKNNLQVVISLLRLQLKELQTQEAIESFQNAIARIMSMSLIHQNLYKSDSLANINIENYFNTLIKSLIDANSVKAEISYSVLAKVKEINAEQMVPLGLIVNELVTNSLKHAFTSNKGTIQFQLLPGNGNKIEMHYLDSGIWKDSNKESLGMELIEIFTMQLDGMFERKSKPEGTLFSFVFNNTNVKISAEKRNFDE
jgi:two-component sensor histidine kinase